MRRWALSIAVVIIGGVVALSGGVGNAPKQHWCAGVGLGTDTYGATARDALSAYVRSAGGDPNDWKLNGNSFETTNPNAKPPGFASISAGEESPGVWRVDGGCVGNSRSTATGNAMQMMEPRHSTTCQALSLAVTQGRRAAPFATWEFALTNTSTRTCVIDGYPGVRILQNAYPLSFDVRRTSGVLVAAPKPSEVSLDRGETAYVVVEKDECGTDDSVVASSADVYPGNDARHLSATLPGHFVLCGDYGIDPILETPVVAALSDAYLATPAEPRCRSKDLAAQPTRTNTETDVTVSWVVRFVNVGSTQCTLTGRPRVYFSGAGGPIVGLTSKQTSADGAIIRGGPPATLRLPPNATAYVAFEKAKCGQPEQDITSASLQPLEFGGQVTIPLPAGLQKCDFKEPAGNHILFGPFVSAAAAALK